DAIVGPIIRLPPPMLSPTFAAVPHLSPEPPVLALPELYQPSSPAHSEVEESIEIDAEVDSTRSVSLDLYAENDIISRLPSPTSSDPPGYESPPMPTRLDLPAHLRPRRPSPPPRVDVPDYTWLSH
nr:hypothetical protein [Tanacetum cinerariifolium]